MNALLRGGCTLAHAEVGVWMRVVSVALDGHERTWLAAMGLGDAQSVQVLRRAAFGGPLHVRLRSGGEFAIDRALADAVELAP